MKVIKTAKITTGTTRQQRTIKTLCGSLGFLMLLSTASAQVSLGIEIGGPPPPPPVVVEQPWVSPGSGAVWIEPHYDWRGRWVWVHGYYEYPPRHGDTYFRGH